MEDETVGNRLCWGENNGGTRENYTIYMAGGLDQHFRGHLLASQFARMACKLYPTAGSSGGMNGVGDGLTVLSIGASLFSQ
jgi:hypothetical protein